MNRRMLKIPIKYRSISETFQLFNILQVDKFWNNRPIIFGVFKAFAFSDQRYSIYRENRVTDSLFRRKTPAPSRSALSNGRDDERSRQEWRILFRELSFGGFEDILLQNLYLSSHQHSRLSIFQYFYLKNLAKRLDVNANAELEINECMHDWTSSG